MAKPPDAHIPKNDRSVWKGLVVDPNEFAPPPPSRTKWFVLALVLVMLAGGAVAVLRFM